MLQVLAHGVISRNIFILHLQQLPVHSLFDLEGKKT